MALSIKSKALALCASVVALASFSSAANAHLVTFGWKDNGNGGVTLYGEHWHGDLSSAFSDNGGITVSNGSTSVFVNWTGVINNVDVADMGLTGYFADPGNGGSGAYDDWMYTVPLALGNGTYSFFTGTNCCVDTMTDGLTFTVTGVTSVDPGTIGNAVPEPATWAMMIGGFGMVGGAMRYRRGKQAVSFA